MTDAIDTETLHEAIEQAISDSIDMDWQASWGADAVMRLPIIAKLPAMVTALRELLCEVDATAARIGWADRGERARARTVLAKIDAAS